MNYYEHHLGDYAEATGHLSFVEDAAYSRMIRKYYASEKPLPADEKAVQRLVGARTKEEREAVATVLQEFFELRADGWHNIRCDEEIERYKEGDAEREQKNAHEKERMRRHREERSRLFAELREHGITPKWDTPVMQLREILNRISNAPETRTGVTGNATATANQSPVTRHQTPDIDTKSSSSESSREFDDDDAPKDPATWAEVFANDHGIDIDHRSAQSRAKFWPLAKGWVQAGVTVGQMRRACAKAREEATEPIAWMPAYVDRVLASMQAPQRQPKQAAEPEWRTEQRNRTLQAVPGIAARTKTPTNIIDVKATNVPAIALD